LARFKGRRSVRRAAISVDKEVDRPLDPTAGALGGLDDRGRAPAFPDVVWYEHDHGGGRSRVEPVPHRARVRRRNQGIQEQPLVSEVDACARHHWLAVGLLGPSRVQDAPDPEVWLEVADLQLRVDAQGPRTSPLWNAPSGIGDGHGRGTRFTLPSPRWPLEFGPDAVGPNHSEGGSSSMCLDC